MRLAVKQVAVEVPNENQDAVIPQDAAAQIGEPEQTPLPMETTESTNDTEDVKEGIEEMPENIADVPNLFSDNEQPLFIMMEFGAVKEDTVWKISYIDFKGAEYADSALTD